MKRKKNRVSDLAGVSQGLEPTPMPEKERAIGGEVFFDFMKATCTP
jgi:hypothetical protein